MAIGVDNEGAGRFIDKWNGSSWKALHLPAVANLDAVACPAANECVAVGNQQASLAWNGKSWRRLTMPKPAGTGEFVLAGVSCASKVSCVAVGGAEKNGALVNMAVAWNGARWRLLPKPPALATAVSCPAPGRCVAVGQGPSLTWNGRSWHTAPVSDGDFEFDSISCVSTSFCVALLLSTALEWNGKAWTTMPQTKIFDNEAVWCTSPTNCMDVGQQATHWNGKTWTPVRITKADKLDVVSCAGTNFCLSLGDSNAASLATVSPAERWNGASWQVVPPSSVPNPALSCTSAQFCLAVAKFGGPGAQQWNGSKWTTVPAPTQQSDTQALSCSSATNCIAVGGSTASIWNGTSWTVTSTGVAGKTVLLDAVSCASDTKCMAAGVEIDPKCKVDCVPNLLVEQWGGSSWSVSFASVSEQAGQTGDQISCPTATFCMEQTGTSSMAWDGGAWQPQSPSVPGFDQTSLSCGNATSCVLVGTSENAEDNGFNSGGQVWNGTSWKSADPVGSHSIMRGVSCASATSCVVVGNTAGFLTMAQSWNGTSWKQLSPVNP